MGLYTGMYSIESTMGKLDLDGSNKITSDETELAYKHFYRGLRSIVLDEVIGEAGIKKDEPEVVRKGIKKYFHDLYSGVKQKAGGKLEDVAIEIVFKYLVRYQKLPLPLNKENLAKLGKEKLKSFPEIDREGIANILVILMELTDPKREKRYKEAKLPYTCLLYTSPSPRDS